MELSFADADVAKTGISLTNAYAVSDLEGLKGEPYSFTITNNCTTPVVVDVNVESLSTSTLPINYVKINIPNCAIDAFTIKKFRVIIT